MIFPFYYLKQTVKKSPGIAYLDLLILEVNHLGKARNYNRLKH